MQYRLYWYLAPLSRSFFQSCESLTPQYLVTSSTTGLREMHRPWELGNAFPKTFKMYSSDCLWIQSGSLPSLLALAESFHYPSDTRELRHPKGLEKSMSNCVSPHKKHHNTPAVGPFQVKSKAVCSTYCWHSLDRVWIIVTVCLHCW